MVRFYILMFDRKTWSALSSLLLERINIRVIDPFTIKPLDSKTIIDNAKATRGRIITVEDHYYEGEESARTKQDK